MFSPRHKKNQGIWMTSYSEVSINSPPIYSSRCLFLIGRDLKTDGVDLVFFGGYQGNMSCPLISDTFLGHLYEQ